MRVEYNNKVDKLNNKPKDKQVDNKIDNYKRYFNSAKACLLKNELEYVIKVEIPAEWVKWTIEDNQFIHFSYTKTNQYSSSHDVIYNEMKFGERHRKIKLPTKVYPDPIKDDWTNGIYTLVFKKVDKIDKEKVVENLVESFDQVAVGDEIQFRCGPAVGNNLGICVKEEVETKTMDWADVQ